MTSSERVHPEHSLNNTRSEDSVLVSQRIMKGLKSLFHSLLYIAALKLSSATIRTRREAGTVVPNGDDVRPDRRPEDRAISGAISLFSKVLLSLPAKETHSSSLSAIEAFAAKLREEVQEFSAREDAGRKPALPRFVGRARVSRSPALESLKVTLNLARGDLESSLAF